MFVDAGVEQGDAAQDDKVETPMPSIGKCHEAETPVSSALKDICSLN